MVSHNTWKYVSMGLLVYMAAAFSIPQASAHITTKTAHMLEHIYNFVDGIEAKTDNLPDDPADQSLIDEQLASLQSDTDDLKTTVGSLSSGAMPKTSQAVFLRDPADAHGFLDDLIPSQNGITYSGTMSGFISSAAGNRITISCFVGGLEEGVTLVVFERNDLSDVPKFEFNEVFACDSIKSFIVDNNGNGEAGGAGIAATIQYFESSDITEIE